MSEINIKLVMRSR